MLITPYKYNDNVHYTKTKVQRGGDEYKTIKIESTGQRDYNVPSHNRSITTARDVCVSNQ